MQKWIIILCLGTTLAICSAVGDASASASATKNGTSVKAPIRVFINDSQFTSSTGAPILKNGTILVPLDSILIAFEGKVVWDKGTGKINVYNGSSAGTIRVRSSVGFINGKKETYAAAPKLIKGSVYVPVRFLADALGGTAVWNDKDRYVNLQYPQYIISTDAKSFFALDGTSGTLYTSRYRGVLIPLGPTIAKLTPGYVGSSSMSVVTTDPGVYLLTINHGFGEPLVNVDVITIFVKDNKILHQARAHYSRFSPRNITVAYNNYAVMNDGTTIRLIDVEGKIAQTYNLLELIGKKKDVYAVEAAAEQYLLVRSNDGGILTLVDLISKQVVELYSYFGIDPKNLSAFNDGLSFTGEQSGKLIFTFKQDGKKEEQTFSYPLLAQ
jgi:hypothetical protein